MTGYSVSPQGEAVTLSDYEEEEQVVAEVKHHQEEIERKPDFCISYSFDKNCLRMHFLLPDNAFFLPDNGFSLTR